ncbi:MAG: hypothetical protein E7474_14990 [Ruminococcaceae bacterium]|nr:hypothetical protein [Oscillospiraceae bacterium]
MKRTFAALAALLLLLAGCAANAEQPSPDDYELYFAAPLDTSDGGDAIRSRTLRIEGGAALDTASLAEKLTAALLDPAAGEGLRSPFPSGTTLQRLSVAGGRAMVDLSEQYGHLSGVDLSIADCCLTLTLTQLEGVNAVRITVNGRELPYRETQLLTAADTLLSGVEDTPRPINVSLFFLDAETGALRAQQQTLALYEGQSRVSAVLAALLRGPEGDDTLLPLLPRELDTLSSRMDGSVCSINLTADTPLPRDENLRALALDSLAHSLLSLSGVERVQLLIGGEIAAEWPAAAEPAAAEPAESES